VTTEETTFDEWAVLELMGHRRLGARVREQQIAGAAFLRVDVPDTTRQPAFTQYYPPSAVYCITPTTEEIARAVAERHAEPPVQRYELPAPRIAPANDDHDDGEYGEFVDERVTLDREI